MARTFLASFLLPLALVLSATPARAQAPSSNPSIDEVPELLPGVTTSPEAEGSSTPPLSVPTAPAETATPSMRQLAWIPAVSGGVFVAGGLLLVGGSKIAEQKVREQDPGRVPSQLVKTLAEGGRSLQTAGWISVGTGAAALGLAAWMFLMPEPGSSRPVVSLVPGRTGWTATLSLTLP